MVPLNVWDKLLLKTRVPCPDFVMFPLPVKTAFDPIVKLRVASTTKFVGPLTRRFMAPADEELTPVIVRFPFRRFLSVAFPLIDIVRVLSEKKLPPPAEIVQAASVPPERL